MNTTPFLIVGGDSRLALGFEKIYPHLVTRLPKNECNILNEKSIRDALKKHQGKYIINCAAITDMNYCEKNPKECFTINIVGPYLLNAICKEFGRKLIHISSDYASVDSNFYGLSKSISEKIIDKNMLVIRTNFYDENTYIIRELLKNRKIEAYNNVFFNPISINQLIKEIVAMKNKHGLVNIFSEKKISFTTFSIAFCAIFNKEKNLIKKVHYKNNNTHIYRPLSSYVKPDITIKIKDDLLSFKNYLHYENN